MTATRSLEEGFNGVISVPADTIADENDGKLVHVSGEATTTATLTDATFGVEAPAALKLVRRVEMYQWEENRTTRTEKKFGGKEVRSTKYSYSKKWSSKLIDSSRFREQRARENPATMPFEQRAQAAKQASLGSFSFSQRLINRLGDGQPLAITRRMVDRLEPSLKAKARVDDGALYVGGDPATPTVGDMRISFRVLNPHVVSVVARQQGNAFGGFTTSSGNTIELVSSGRHSAAAMFKTAQENNVATTWIFRAIGCC